MYIYELNIAYFKDVDIKNVNANRKISKEDDGNSKMIQCDHKRQRTRHWETINEMVFLQQIKRLSVQI